MLNIFYMAARLSEYNHTYDTRKCLKCDYVNFTAAYNMGDEL